MCGIVGRAGIEPDRQSEWLTRANVSLRHRGPDDSGIWWNPSYTVGLAHSRLAIIDLSAAARQPMTSNCGKRRLVFNGEIYNYRELRRELSNMGHHFKSASDTEVILAAYAQWGSSCVARLDGAFALALYDEEMRTVFLARDRAGEKPLYYAFVSGVLCFASEIKALLCAPGLSRQVSINALEEYLRYGFVAAPHTLLAAIKKVPPATAIEYKLDPGVASSRRYWSIPSAPDGSADPGSLTEELRSILRAAVDRQLHADVPVAIMLSGGLDSSLITALAAERRRTIRTYTVAFPEYTSHDESKHAERVAKFFDTQHTVIKADHCEPDILRSLSATFDEPIIDSSMIPTYLVSKAVREHCKVALGGDGGDELFGGYQHYSRILWMNKHLQSPRLIRAGVAYAAAHLMPVGLKGRNWALSLDPQGYYGAPTVASYFDTYALARLFQNKRKPRHITYHAGRYDLLRNALERDFTNYLAEDILVKTDRASMSVGLELRAPFLDVRVIEFAFGQVPSHLKATTSARKILLRRLAAEILPKKFDTERKQGFSVPLAQWLKTRSWQQFFSDVLFDPCQKLFSQQFIAEMLRGISNGRANSERLFGLVIFELWRRHYAIETPQIEEFSAA
jgi:asparagine synthase (glutamine-hydrolysing)